MLNSGTRNHIAIKSKKRGRQVSCRLIVTRLRNELDYQRFAFTIKRHSFRHFFFDDTQKQTNSRKNFIKTLFQSF